MNRANSLLEAPSFRVGRPQFTDVIFSGVPFFLGNEVGK